MVEEAEVHDQGRKIKISHPGYLAVNADFVEDYYSPFLEELLSVSLQAKGDEGKRETPVTKCGIFVFDLLSRSVVDTSFCRKRFR
jgi:hypothetical protein